MARPLGAFWDWGWDGFANCWLPARHISAQGPGHMGLGLGPVGPTAKSTYILKILSGPVDPMPMCPRPRAPGPKAHGLPVDPQAHRPMGIEKSSHSFAVIAHNEYGSYLQWVLSYSRIAL